MMSGAARSALRMALAAGATALVAGSLHIPQTFLSVLAAQLTTGIAFQHGRSGFLLRLAAAFGGSLTGLLLLISLSDQYWFSLPAFGVLAGWGTLWVARRGDPGAAILFCMGLCGMFSAGIVEPAPGILVGIAHGLSLATAVVFSRLAQWVLPVSVGPAHLRGPEPRALQIGVTAPFTLVAACAAFPSMAVVSTIASLATVLTLSPGARDVWEKLCGGALGVAASFAFLTVVSGAGNDLALFLLGLAGALGVFEWIACRCPQRGPLFRQAGALFAVAATILPRPSDSLFASTERQMAVLLGLAVAAALHLAMSRRPAGSKAAS